MRKAAIQSGLTELTVGRELLILRDWVPALPRGLGELRIEKCYERCSTY